MTHPEKLMFLRIGILAVLSFIFFHTPSFAHDFWKTGEAVDPQTKNKCCGWNDTKELDPKVVVPMKGGFFLMDTHEFIANARVQPSQDNSIWASRWGGETKCFFYPMSY